MNIFNKASTSALAVSIALTFVSPTALLAAGPAAVNLGTASNFTVLAKTGISTTGTTSVVGDIGVSPAQATYITGFSLSLPSASAFSTSPLVSGKIYAPGYADPTPANLTTAIGDMQTAYTDAQGRTAPAPVTELGAGSIGGMTLAPGLYKWGTGVTIPSDVTLSGSANDVWIFQVAQNLDISSAAKINLSGGAQSGNVFWAVAGQATIGTTAVFNGNILSQTAIVLNTGATLNGRALAQTAVTLDSNVVSAAVASTPAIPAVPAIPAEPTVTSATPATSAIPASSASSNNSGGSAVSVVVTTDAGCVSGNKFSTVTGKNCTSSASTNTPVAITDAGCVSGNKFSTVTGKNCSSSTGANASVVPLFGEQTIKARVITANLWKGNRSSDVAVLQKYLISQNKGPAALALAANGSTTYFGELTRSALAEFQASVGISPSSGNFGAKTRAYISSH
ncbi:MAG: ice-binding family protein [bacterium]|nr:ice-binding family protein [bacterium]